MLLPFIDGSRKEFDYLEEGEPIPDDMSTVCWYDGDINQVEEIVSVV